MLVIPQRKAVVVRSRNPQQLLALIPTAKLVQHKGNDYVALPHRIDEMRVLKNLGMAPPSPIRYHYAWSGTYTPFKAQMDTAEFLTLNRRAYVLNDLGSGKTLASLWAYDYLRTRGYVKRLLVVCPLSTVERTWGDELWRHFPHLDYVVLHGSRARRLKLLDQPADVYIVNHDGLDIIKQDLGARADIDIVVVDELSQVARNSGTRRWKALNDVINHQQQGKRWGWGMTGTPTPNAPTDAWAQCRLLTPQTVPPYFVRFKEAVMKQMTPFLWVPRVDAQARVHEAMQPAIRFKRSECVDLPPCMFQQLQIELTDEQKAAYKDMVAKLKFEADEGSVTAVNEAVKAQKLVQIACGVAYDAKGNEITLGAQPRLDEVLRIVKEAEGKTIVFVPFVSTIDYVADFLRKQGISTECIHGAVSKHERNRIFGAFQGTSGEPQVIVAQPASMSHGLTLTAANTIIWYAPIFSNDIFDQACGRITRPGQTLSQLIVMLEGSPIERRAYDRLRNKQRMQGILLSMVEDSRTDTVTT
jgi:SNF2 family DNA or RNA helicase